MPVQLGGAGADDPPAQRVVGQGELVACDVGGDDGTAP